MKKSFGISTENVQVLVVSLWTEVKNNNFEESEKATVRPELRQKTEWLRQESETQGFKFRQLWKQQSIIGNNKRQHKRRI